MHRKGKFSEYVIAAQSKFFYFILKLQGEYAFAVADLEKKKCTVT